jgi:hypothetical protein
VATTLAQMRTRVRELADMQDSTFVTDSELAGYLNRALWALDDLLHNTWEDYYAVEETVTFSGTSYTLPSDFYRLIAVDVRGSTGAWVGLTQYNVADRNLYRNSTLTTPEAQAYRLSGRRSLLFLPGFSGNVDARLIYYAQQPALALDSDTRDYPNGWEEWAILKAAIVCLGKEERDATHLERMLAMEDSRIRDAAPQRELAPVTVADVETASADLSEYGPTRRR